jgi:exoribonuclease-2
MFPERLSYDLASLNQDQWRPTMSFEVDFDADARILDWRLSRGQIRVTHRLSYAQVDEMLQSPATDELTDLIHRLAALTQKLTDQRLACGAIIIRRPQLKIHVKDDHITVKALDPNSPARQLISEVMILANRLAAQHATREGVPVIFRTQDAPQGEPGFHGAESGYDPISVIKVLKGMRRSRLSLSPQPHAGLGLDAYTQLTSPIRRFSDVVIQRQMAASLAGEPLPYEKEELLDVLSAAESAEREMRAIERQSINYWALEYLARQCADGRQEGWIIEEVKGGYMLELNGLFIQGFLTTKARYEPGDYLSVRIDHIDPKKSVLRLRETE